MIKSIFTKSDLKEILPEKNHQDIYGFIRVSKFLGLIEETENKNEYKFLSGETKIPTSKKDDYIPFSKEHIKRLKEEFERSNSNEENPDIELESNLSTLDLNSISKILQEEATKSLKAEIKPTLAEINNDVLTNETNLTNPTSETISIPLEVPVEAPKQAPDSPNNPHATRPAPLYNGQSTDGTWLSALKNTKWYKG